MSVKSLLDLTGRTALVTGGSRGLGLQIAEALGEMGAKIAITARKSNELDEARAHLEESGVDVLTITNDLSKTDTVPAMVDAVLQRFGRIDILVNNAALRREKPFAEMSYADWREIMDVTLDGAFHCVKACLPALRQGGAGTVINIGGLSAHTGAKNRAHVVTAKAGLIGFTRALAHDLSDDGITVNCVVPGLIGTPRPKDQPEPAHHLTHGTISGKRGTPDDVAATVRFLCSPAARYITGQAVHVNGGAYLGA